MNGIDADIYGKADDVTLELYRKGLVQKGTLTEVKKTIAVGLQTERMRIHMSLRMSSGVDESTFRNR